MRFLLRLLIYTLVFAIIVVATQHFQFFPGAYTSLFVSSKRNPTSLPAGVTSNFIETKDKELIEVWRQEVDSNDKRVAIIFHGNAGDIENFYAFQKYFRSIGITNYAFDYRGYGKSSGWPSEDGLYLDGKATTEYVLKREDIPSTKLIIVGISIGSGPASEIAKNFKVGTLLLFAPFTSLPDAVKIVPLFGLLHPFTIYDFPVQKNVEQLNYTCLIIAHGTNDGVIPYSQGKSSIQRLPRLG